MTAKESIRRMRAEHRPYQVRPLCNGVVCLGPAQRFVNGHWFCTKCAAKQGGVK